MSVAEFYRDKCVLITGASGFMGKVLLEKLLRSCHQLGTVYIILRPKHGRTAEERGVLLLQNRIFHSVSDRLCKVIALSGDLSKPKLDLSAEDRQLLLTQVNVIFHTAATVKFDESLPVSLDMNVRGTRSLLQLASSMCRLEVLVHVSTAYSNCTRHAVDERVYECRVDPNSVLAAAECLGQRALCQFTDTMLDDHPNTYTFTKALAESVVDQYKCRFPVAIVRPSIVTCAWKEPLPGWIDSFNGATGLMVGLGKGFLRSILADPDKIADLIPVDIPVNLMICVAWQRAISQQGPHNQLPVYNCVSGTSKPITWGQFESMWIEQLASFPMLKNWRIYGSTLTPYRHAYTLWSIIYHFVPALAFDIGSRLLGCPSKLYQLQCKLRKTINCLSFFTMRQWSFKCDGMTRLWSELEHEDRSVFNFSLDQFNWRDYMKTYRTGVDNLLLKTTISDQKPKRDCKLLIFLLLRNVSLFLFIFWSLPKLTKYCRDINKWVILVLKYCIFRSQT